MLDQLPNTASPYWPTPPPRLFTIGLDCGSVRDHSALVVAENYQVLQAPGDPMFGEEPVWETHYKVLGCERVALGTSYPAVAQRVRVISKRLHDRDEKAQLHALVDATGVGVAVVQLVRDAVIPACRVTAVTITAGSGDKGDDSILYRTESRVSKSWLVSRLQAILQAGRLHAPRDAALEELINELKTFEIRVRPETGNPESGAFTVGAHDDLAVALALCTSASFAPIQFGPGLERLGSGL